MKNFKDFLIQLNDIVQEAKASKPAPKTGYDLRDPDQLKAYRKDSKAGKTAGKLVGRLATGPSGTQYDLRDPDQWKAYLKDHSKARRSK